MSLLHPGIEAFVAVVKHHTVHGAANDIGLSQTGVTQRIRSLEKQLGTTLFTRSRKGMRLTQEGESLHRYCQSVSELEGELMSALNHGQQEHVISINITGPSSIMRSRIIPATVPVMSKYHNIVFTFNFSDETTSLSFLKSGESQLAILPRHQVVNELDAKLLRPSKYILVAKNDWNCRPLSEIISTERIIDFNASDDVTFQYLKKHNLFKQIRLDRHLANNIDALASLVAQGHGYTVLSEDFAKDLIIKKQLTEINPGKKLELEFALAWYPRHEMPEYFADLIKAIN